MTNFSWGSQENVFCLPTGYFSRPVALVFASSDVTYPHVNGTGVLARLTALG